jgi:hypothetical protein
MAKTHNPPKTKIMFDEAGDGLGVGLGVGLGAGAGVGLGVGLGEGLGVGAGVGLGVGASVKDQPDDDKKHGSSPTDINDIPPTFLCPISNKTIYAACVTKVTTLETTTTTPTKGYLLVFRLAAPKTCWWVVTTPTR